MNSHDGIYIVAGAAVASPLDVQPVLSIASYKFQLSPSSD